MLGTKILDRCQDLADTKLYARCQMVDVRCWILNVNWMSKCYPDRKMLARQIPYILVISQKVSLSKWWIPIYLYPKRWTGYQNASSIKTGLILEDHCSASLEFF